MSLQRTDRLLHKTIKFTIETNLLTTIGAIVEFTLWRAMPYNRLHFILYASCLPTPTDADMLQLYRPWKTVSQFGHLSWVWLRRHSYANVLLASLNSRMFSTRLRGLEAFSETAEGPIFWADISRDRNISTGQANTTQANSSRGPESLGSHETTFAVSRSTNQELLFEDLRLSPAMSPCQHLVGILTLPLDWASCVIHHT